MSGGQFNIAIVFCGNNGAGGQLGSTHSWLVGSLFSQVSGLKMAIPATPGDTKGLFKTAIRADDPVFFLESERLLGMTGSVPADEDHLIPFGIADIKLYCDHCMIVALGRGLHFDLEAAVQLTQEGIHCEVIDPRTVRPLDIDTIVQSVRKTSCLVVVDQSWPFALLASEIAAQVDKRAFDDLDNHNCARHERRRAHTVRPKFGTGDASTCRKDRSGRTIRDVCLRWTMESMLTRS